MKHIGFQKIHKFNTATQVSTTFVTDKATATSWATSTNTTSAVTTSTTTTSNWTTEWLTSTSTLTTWSTSSIINFNTSTTWGITVGASSSWSTSSTIQTLKSTSSSFTTQVATSKTTHYYRNTSYTASTTKYRNTTKSATTSWSTTVSGSATVNFTTYYNASTFFQTYVTTCGGYGGGGGGFYCLPTDTLISINTTIQRPIQELQVGDTILSKGGGFNTDDHMEMHNYDVANMTGHLKETTITNIFSLTSEDNINFNDGHLIATRMHYHLMKINGRWAIRPIYVAQQFVDHNDPVFFYDVNGNEIEITSAVNETEPITVWEIDTEPNDVFFANGLLTHNYKRS